MRFLFIFLNKVITILSILILIIFFTSILFVICSEKEFNYQEYGVPEDLELPLVNTKGDREFTEQEEEMIKRGNLIIAAIKKFYKDNGFYPKALCELKPKYIKKLPLSPLSNLGILKSGYRYDVKHANPSLDIQKADRKELKGFFLHCRYNFDEEYFYNSYNNTWSYHYH